ncbi:MAG: BrnA antitoxin family protein [Xanthobacteraceae bacterium]|nr:BrnA antitoxin family protein [Xanthobacteraceae bacterium]
MPRKVNKKKRLDDNPEWTKDDFAKAMPIKGGLQEVAKSLRGRPKLAHPKEAIKLRLDADVLAAYRKTGAGWQTQINADLRKARRLKAS